ncbi:uncharacterized protein LOC117343981 [Pecten maximus]|uniref:uncharacterized protein LOC117343981 n=1 Tax=Pecten maximus TaxID=6579 RepID=UPI0014589DB2|nr:uncharacterized protein LOC117343981 [Pecten maximus]
MTLASTVETKTMKVQLLVLCMMSLIVVTKQLGISFTCDRNTYTDGCSVPKGIKIEFKGRFKPACNKHDICYSCMKTFGLSRLQCDQRFKKNMKGICNTLGGKNFLDKFLKRESCKTHADIYYVAVRVGGASATKNRGRSRWCRQKWVKPCMQ